MSLDLVYEKLKENLQFFRIQTSDISSRHRILVDEAVRNLDCIEDDLDEESYINIGALRSRAWDIIHTGKWSDVRAEDKYLYSLATYLEVLCEFREHLIANKGGPAKRWETFMEHCIESLDMAILLGSPVPDDTGLNVFCTSASIITRWMNEILNPDQFPLTLITNPVDLSNHKIDIPSIDGTNLLPTTFQKDFNDPGMPLLITNNLQDWPASDKWKDVSYFQRNFGFRTVPIEVGSQYTTEDWGQELMLFKDFIESQFGKCSPDNPIQYLAQHDLFRQIPELQEDIRRPSLLDDMNIPKDSVDIKIWFGPGGTVSPLHYDKKENFLCQVIGWKRIILISPTESEFVYPFDGDMMSNTSQLDLTQEIDKDKYPLAKKINQLQVILGPGQTLFIPYGWWHHVSSLSPSISVSFWWNK